MMSTDRAMAMDRLRRYEWAVVAVVAATFVRMALEPVLGPQHPLVTYYLAVTLASLYGGLGPSLLAVALGGIAADVLFIEPRGSLAVPRIDQFTGLCVYFISGIAISFLGGEKRSALALAEEKTSLLEQEAALRGHAEQEREQSLSEAQRLKAEAEERAATLSAVLELTPVGIVLFDTELRYTVVNATVAALSGHAPEELLGRTMEEAMSDFFSPAEAVETGRALRLALQKGEPVRHRAWCSEARLLRGQPFYSDWSAQRVTRPDGSTLGLLVTVTEVTDHLLRERAARENETRLRLAVEGGGHRLFELNLQTGRLVTNSEFTDGLGHDPDDDPRTYDDVIESAHPDDREALRQAIEATRTGERPGFRLEHRKRSRSGDWGWVLCNGRVVEHDAEGRPLRMVGTHTDVTERKQAEGEIRRLNEGLERMVAERTAELDSVLNNATIGLASVDREARFVRINRCLAEINGHSVEAHLGRSVREMSPGCGDGPERLIKEVFDTGRTIRRLEIHSSTPAQPDDVRSWVVSYYPIVGVDGAVRSVGTTVDDVTESKRAEQELAALNQALRDEIAGREQVEQRMRRLTAVIEASPDFVAVADPSGKILYWNLALGDVTGRAPGDEPFHVSDTHTDSANHLLMTEGLPTAARNGVWVGESELKTRDGRTLPVSQVILAHFSPEGDLEYYSTIMRDISERTRMEEALRHRSDALAHANAELGRAARLKDEFLANMSHELRTPLNGILSMSQALQEQVFGPINARQSEALTDLEMSGRHLLGLINDILDLSKVEAGKLTLDPGPTVVENVCRGSVRMVHEVALKKGQRVSLTLDPAVSSIVADQRLLKQMLVNLLSNAVKFTPEGGTIGLEVSGDASRGVVSFTVSDTGIGIASEDLPRVFQPFTQLDSRLSKQYPGTGLGLSLVWRMADLHAGGVTVESEPDLGSRFTITLPWVVATDDAEDFSARSREPGPLPAVSMDEDGEGRPLVLVAEDNELNARGMIDYMSSKGFRVAHARDGAEAVRKAAELKPRAILMDIQMPIVHGLEAIRNIRADPAMKGIVVIALTALAMPGDRERCLEGGADAYLSKPVVLRELYSILESLTARRP
jgi:PAS domain S-box-containing protein